jgi:outer membrane protein insertion porin family
VAVVVALLLGFFPQEPLRRLVEARLQQALGPGARVSRLRVWPARLYAEIDGLVVDAPAYRLEARTARVTIDRRTLLAPVIALRSLEADGVTLLVRGDAPQAPASSDTATRTVVMGSVRVSNATVRYEARAVGGAIALEGVTLEGAVGHEALELSATGGRWEAQDTLPLGPTRARVRITPTLDMHVEAFEAGLARTRVSASGALGSVVKMEPDLRWNATVDVAEIAKPAGLGDASGTLRAQGTLAMPASGLIVVADVSGENLRRGEWSADTLQGRVTHEGTRTKGRLEAALLGGAATLEAARSGTSVQGRLVLTGLDLARLGASSSLAGRASGTVEFRGDPPGALTIDARVTAEGRSGTTPFRTEVLAGGAVASDGSRIDLDWAATGEGGDTSASVRFQGSGRAHGAIPPVVEGRIDGAARTPRTGELPFDADVGFAGGEVRITGVVRGLGEPVTLDAALKEQRLTRFALSGGSIPLARLMPGLEGQARFAAEASGRLDAPSGRASVQLEDAAWRGVAIGPATAELTAKDGAASFELHVPDWNVSGRGDVAADRLRTLRGRVDLTATPLDRLAPLLPEGPPLSGRVTASIDLDVPLGRPAGAQMRVEIPDLDVTRGELHVRNQGPVRLGWREGRVQVERLALEGGGFAVRAGGTLGLAETDALELQVAAESELDTLPLPEGWTLAGRVATELDVGGTRRRPLLTGDVTFEDAGVSGPSLPPFSIPEGRVELAGETLVLPDLPVLAAGGRIVVSGRVPLAAALPAARARGDRVAPDEAADVRVSWQGLHAEEWPQGGGDARLVGTLNGTLAVSGGLAALAEMQARLDVPATSLGVEEMHFQVDPFTASLADGRLQLEALQIGAADSVVRLAGSADLVRRKLDASALGSLNLRALSPFVPEAALFGTAEMDVSASGDWSAPDVRGEVTLEDASLRLRLLPQALTSLGARVVFDGRTLSVPRATAVMGGGDIEMTGDARLQGGLADARFTITGRGISLTYPPGLRSRLDADLTLSGGPEAYKLAGDVKVERGLFDLDIVFEQSLTAPKTTPTDSQALRRIALDLRVEIESPIQVRNNMTDLQATGALTVRGDMNAPSPVGNLEIETAGKVYLSGRGFEITSGRITYRGNWDPQVVIEATDLISGSDANNFTTEYEVTVRLVGSMERPGLQMTSDPPLSEGQIVSLIATGRTDSGGSALKVAVGGQAAMLLAGRLTRKVRELGLDEVSVQPELVAREGGNETGARFTFGKRLTQRLELIYSLSLQDPEARFILLEARPGHGIVVRGQRNDAGTLAASVGQRFQFGGPKRRRPPSVERRVRLTEVRFDGEQPIPNEELARLAKVHPGQRKTVWDLQDDADRLRDRLIERGYVEAEVGVRLEDGVAIFRARTGARYEWRVAGMTQPPDLTKVIREALFEEEAIERGREALLRVLHERGHLRARVSARAEPADGRRILVFEAEPETRYDPVRVLFPGAHALSTKDLVRDAGGAGRIVSEPGEARRAIVEAYHRAFYLTAQVDPPVITSVPPSGLDVTVTVREGPRATLGAVRFEGSTRPTADLEGAAALHPGEFYDPAAALAATDRLREHYFRLGHGDVRVQAAAVPNGPQVDVVFTVEEGRRAVLGRIVIQGLRVTREALVRKQIRLRPGAPLDPRRLANLERRLLDMRLFSRVITSVSDEDPATLTISLEEDDRFYGRYALSYEQERLAPGEEVPNFLERSAAEVDAEVRNLLGWGATAGARARVGADARDASASIAIPSLPWVGNFTGNVFLIQEDIAITPDPVTGDRRESQRTQNGFEVSFTRRLPRRTDLLYGYRFEDSEVVSPDFIEPQTARTAVLRASVLRDTRDSILDARTGRFLSVSIDYAPAFLRGDFTFMKGLAQGFLARPVGPSMTWGQGYRIGLGTGFGGQNIRSTERFRAGGANTIRGYETDSVGPFDPLTKSFTGGEAVVIVNEELRYRHSTGLGAAVFYDGGNVFAKVEDVSFEWLHSVGVGLRWDSPIGLLRLDLGLPLNRRTLPFDPDPDVPPRKESGYQLFFSFGQAF